MRPLSFKPRFRKALRMDDPVTFQFPVSGMTRASCAVRVEQALQKVDGVRKVHVDFADQQARLQAPAGSLYALLDALQAAGYGVREDVLELSVTGMTWASCVGRVERALGDVPAVKGARVDLATERALVKTCGTVDPAALIAAVAKTGYSASLVQNAGTSSGDPQRRPAAERWSLALAIALSVALLLPKLFGLTGLHRMFPAWVQFALATPVQFVLGERLYIDAWKALRSGSGTLDWLIVSGASAGFGLSVYNWANTARGGVPHLYLDASAAVTTLVLLGKYLNGRLKRHPHQYD
jgi:P-type Cu+ transporter